MKWYAAHIVMYVKLKGSRRQQEFPIWENVVLVSAPSEEKAFCVAEEIGRRDAGDDDGTFKWNGIAAEWIFAGVRKLTLCDEPDERPRNLSELTYFEMTVTSEKAVRELVDGKSTKVTIGEACREEQLT